jgi:hypothetical protein
MNYSGSMVLEKRFLNDPKLIFAFFDYLHFEEDLALYLRNLQFPIPMNDLYQV